MARKSKAKYPVHEPDDKTLLPAETWALQNLRPKEGEKGLEMYVDRGYRYTDIYFSREQLEYDPDMDEDAKGTPVHDYNDKSLRTARQWDEAGYSLKEDAVGLEMYPSYHHRENVFTYYSEDEVTPRFKNIGPDEGRELVMQMMTSFRESLWSMSVIANLPVSMQTPEDVRKYWWREVQNIYHRLADMVDRSGMIGNTGAKLDPQKFLEDLRNPNRRAAETQSSE